MDRYSWIPENWKSPSGRTWLGDEQAAYNTYRGGHSRSNRRCRAICKDGKIRIITIGIPDTFFTIPGHARINGRYVSGYVSVASNNLLIGPGMVVDNPIAGEFEFRGYDAN